MKTLYSTSKFNIFLVEDEMQSIIPDDFNIDEIEKEVIKYFVRQMHRDIKVAYGSNPDMIEVLKQFEADCNKNYLGKYKGYGDLFVANCYDRAFDVVKSKIMEPS